MKSIAVSIAAALALIGAPAALSATAPPVPAGPAVLTVTVPGTQVTSAALQGGPDELTVTGAQCANGDCRVSLSMGPTGGIDLRRVDPNRVATLQVATDRGLQEVTLTAAPSMRAEIAGATDTLASIQRLIGMVMIIALAVVSVFWIEIDPFRAGVHIPRRVTVASWVVGLLPVTCATAVVIAMGGGSRGFMLCAMITAWGIPLLRMLVVWLATRPGAATAPQQ